MLRLALFLAPFALGVAVCIWTASQKASRRFWSILLLGALAGLFPALRIVERITGTRIADALSARVSAALGCQEIGCGALGGAFYAIAVGCLLFAVGLLAGRVLKKAFGGAVNST